MLSATASLGLILLWDVDGGLTQIDKYLYSSEDFIKAGALLACGEWGLAELWEGSCGGIKEGTSE